MKCFGWKSQYVAKWVACLKSVLSECFSNLLIYSLKLVLDFCCCFCFVFWILSRCNKVIQLYCKARETFFSSTLMCFIGKLGVKQQLLVYGYISVCLCQCNCIISSQIKLFPKPLRHIWQIITVYFIFCRDTVCVCCQVPLSQCTCYKMTLQWNCAAEND